MRSRSGMGLGRWAATPAGGRVWAMGPRHTAAGIGAAQRSTRAPRAAAPPGGPAAWSGAGVVLVSAAGIRRPIAFQWEPPMSVTSATLARTSTLADLAWPRAGLRSNLVLIVAASALTALAAQLALPLPFSPVPVTGQTFAVLLTGAALGARRGAAAQLLYLAEGAAGLPVFAGWAGGAHVLLGPTGGYLVAFPFAAAIVGALCERGWDRRFGTMFVAMLLGSVAIFAVGIA